MSTHKPRKRGKPSGRVVFDDRGNASWDWHGETDGLDGEIDTQKLKRIGADLGCEDEQVPDGGPNHDPYNRTVPRQSDPSGPKRRSLDDLRKLSEEIKASRNWKDRRSR
ncbi:MAG: hypothetical protein M0038_06015 [Pseudomonadota bacterium]|jgi:hypothetical protein|nr:hypothetical protein [Pseudomonadota bacterium]